MSVVEYDKARVQRSTFKGSRNSLYEMCTVVHQADTEEEGTVNDNDQWRTRWKRNTPRDKEY